MELKYKSSDTIKLIDIFTNLSKGINDNILLAKKIEKLSQYPVYIVNEFLKCVNVLTIEQIKTNRIGVIGYITIRLNFAQETEKVEENLQI
jgi:hypothetical protein